MDPRRRRLIEDSWSRLEGSPREVAGTFYQRLFQLDPRIKDLFAIVVMEDQQEKFSNMLGELVRLMGNPEGFESLLRESGRRHREYGVVARDYATVGEALLWALDRALPGGLDDATREAWAEAYTRMSFLMQQSGE